MRLWDAERPGDQAESSRRYEVVGYVLKGRAELHIEGQLVLLGPGDSYVVPRGARHHYRILEAFSTVEATSPPAHVHGRDEPLETAGDDIVNAAAPGDQGGTPVDHPVPDPPGVVISRVAGIDQLANVARAQGAVLHH